MTSPTGNYPLINRAIDSAGPTGSTFKPITAIAALQSGAWLPDETFDDTGQFCINGACRHNAGARGRTAFSISPARSASPTTVFFYNLGAR